jgi:hypothetical protein
MESTKLLRNLAQDTYEVTFRVDPPYPFGLPHPGYMVVPHDEEWRMNFDHDLGAGWATRLDGTDSTRRANQILRAEIVVRGIRVRARDNIFTVRLPSNSRETAVEEARKVLEMLLRTVCTYWENPGFDFVTRALRVFNDGRVSERERDLRGGLYVYDTRQFAELLSESAALIEPGLYDQRLTRALKYFGLGDDLLRMKSDTDEEDDRLLAITPLRFLQYWKSIAVILGDPSKDRDHQSRPNKLGLGRHFFRQRIKPLDELRNNFDVAHVTDPNAPRIVSPEQTDECRRTAVKVIHTYAGSLGAVTV